MISFEFGERMEIILGDFSIISCRATDGIGTNGLKITRDNFSCTVTGSTIDTCGENTLTGVLNGDLMMAYLNISSVECLDNGTVECSAVSDPTNKAVIRLDVTSKSHSMKK